METEMSPQKSSMSKTSMVLIGVIAIALIVTIFTIVKGLKSDGNSGGSPSPDPGGNCSQTGESCDDPSDCCNEDATCDGGTCAGGSTPTPPSGGSCSKTHPENKGECSTDSPACPENQFCCTPSPGGCPTECANYCFCSIFPTGGVCPCPFEMDENGCCAVPENAKNGSFGNFIPAKCSKDTSPDCMKHGNDLSCKNGCVELGLETGGCKDRGTIAQDACFIKFPVGQYCENNNPIRNSAGDPVMWWTGQYQPKNAMTFCEYSAWPTQQYKDGACSLGGKA